MRNPTAAMKWATTTDRLFEGLCDHFVAVAYGLDHSGYPTAMDHWKQTPADMKNTSNNPPVGSLVFWDTGKPAGHVAIVTGVDDEGQPLVTTTHTNNGKPTTMRLDSIGMKYLGWSQPYFGGQTVSLRNARGVVIKPDQYEDGGDNSGVDLSGATITDPDPMYFEPDDLNMKSLRQEWGIAGGVFDEYPELKNTFREIIAQNITDPSRQLAMLKETDFWQKHTSNWMEVEKSRLSKDPAIWKALVTNRAERIKQQFTEAGAELDDETAIKYAKNMIYGSGWNGEGFTIYDEQWMNDKVVAAIDFTKTKTINGVPMYDLKGKAEEAATEMYSLARDYGMDTAMTNKGFTTWFEKSLKGFLDGSLSKEDVDDELVNNAMSRFPGLTPQLQRGLSVRKAADPYLKSIADTLDLDPESLSLDDNLVQQVLNNVDQSGNFKPMSLYDARLAARRDSRWKYTETAKTEYSDMGSQILKDFGFLG